MKVENVREAQAQKHSSLHTHTYKAGEQKVGEVVNSKVYFVVCGRYFILKE